MTNRRQPEATVLPVHFEDRSGAEFERLCFAYLLRAFKVVVMDLRHALQEWTDLDVAAFHLARCVSIIGMEVDFHAQFKHAMWSENPLGNSLVRILRELVTSGVLEEDDERVRWNRAYEGIR